MLAKKKRVALPGFFRVVVPAFGADFVLNIKSLLLHIFNICIYSIQVGKYTLPKSARDG